MEEVAAGAEEMAASADTAGDEGKDRGGTGDRALVCKAEALPGALPGAADRTPVPGSVCFSAASGFA